ncbi:MAG: glutaredoxin family protein [Dehalococcoidia bacterium]|nr:glutaredoxin family protein [Dehalococcoidia bacterium]
MRALRPTIPDVSPVTLYGRPGCHLCEEARSILDALQPELGLRVEEVNIEDDDDLLKRYQWTIPVVALDGHDVISAPFSSESLRAVLAAALEASTDGR